MKTPKPFQFKVRKPARPDDLPLNRIAPQAAESEQFTGEIQGLPASDLEERFARGLDRLRLGYTFRKAFFGARGTLGEVELDFEIYDGPLTIPVQVDGEYAHGSATQRNHDAQQDAILNDYLAKQGGTLPVKRIPAVYLQDQAQADRVVRELI